MVSPDCAAVLAILRDASTNARRRTPGSPMLDHGDVGKVVILGIGLVVLALVDQVHHRDGVFLGRLAQQFDRRIVLAGSRAICRSGRAPPCGHCGSACSCRCSCGCGWKSGCPFRARRPRAATPAAARARENRSTWKIRRSRSESPRRARSQAACWRRCRRPSNARPR